jgi:lipid A 3-O-deacylase
MRQVTTLVFVLFATTMFAQDAANPLRGKPWEVTPWVQGGTGLGVASDFKFVSVGTRVGKVVTDEIGTGWFRGTFELAADVIPLYEVHQPLNYISGPADWIYAFAANPVIFKWNWTAGRRVVPYFSAEGGLLLSTRDVPMPGTSSVNFMPGGAFGFHILRANGHAWTASVHITHISNASLGDKNPGINATLQFRVGYSWFR